jgi:leader peptidase (prepilin peptidase)/N-methyltransferase
MDDLLLYLLPALVLVWVFVLGTAVGSFLNVCIYRLPRRKNLLWPSSRCGVCLRAIPLYLNVPLVSWWWLRGRCRFCGSSFSMRYFWVELLTGLVVAGLYAVEVGLNVHGLAVWRDGGFSDLLRGQFPPHAWPYLFFHTVLAGLLIASAGCLIEGPELPRSLVITGAVVGLAWALLYPWPEPLPRSRLSDSEPPGFMPWPVWLPLPDWLPPASVALGLATGLAGILGPAWLARLTVWLARRVRGGTSDRPELAGLLMMTGGFLGWQPLVVALALAGLLTIGLVLCGGLFGQRPRQPLVLLFIACLAVTWLGWAWLGALVRPWLLSPAALAGCLFGLAGLLAVAWEIQQSGAELSPPAPVPPEDD